MNIVITGASRGIGRSIADRFYSKGFNVIGIHYDSFIHKPAPGIKFELIKADVSDISSLNQVSEKLGDIKLSGLINAAGIYENRSIEDFDPSRYKRIIDVNLLGTINSCKVFAKKMDADTHTPIINFGSIAAHIQNTSFAYSSSKAAVENFTRSLALQFNKTKIRPNCLCPGYVDTDMTMGSPENLVQEHLKNQVLQNKINIDDIVDIVELLFDERSRSISGQCIQIG